MRRNVKSLITETMLPIAFICLGIFLLNFAPTIGNKPPLELHPWHQRTSAENRLFFKSSSSSASDLEKSVWTSLTHSPGPGLRCLSNNRSKQHVLYQDESTKLALDCDTNSSLISSVRGNRTVKMPRCSCQNGFPSSCGNNDDLVLGVESHRLRSRDIIYKLDNVESVDEWLINTELRDEFLLNRYGGFEFIELDAATRLFYDDLRQVSFSALELIDSMDSFANRNNFSKTARLAQKYREFFERNWVARRKVKIWYNNKGNVNKFNSFEETKDLYFSSNDCG